MKVTAFNIIWDTDNQEVDLPKELTFNISDDIEIGDITDILIDKISDETGFLHKGFEIKF